MSGIATPLTSDDLARLIGGSAGAINPAAIVKNTAAESAIVAGVVGQQVFCDRLLIIANAAAILTIRSGMGGTILVSGASLLATVVHDFSGLWSVADGDGITLTTSADVAIRGFVAWRYVTRS